MDDYAVVFTSNRSQWEITGSAYEYGYVYLQLPEGAPMDDYTLWLVLYDERGAIEDTLAASIYLYPPDMNPSLESCNESGEQQDTYELAHPIFAMGEGYVPSTSYIVYVVSDVVTWTDGLAIPSRVAGTETTVMTNAEGVITPTVVWWNPLTEGAFDMVVDTNGNGQYDAGVDALDDSDIEVTAGWIVIPEFSPFLLLPTLLGGTLLATFLRRQPKSRARIVQVCAYFPYAKSGIGLSRKSFSGNIGETEFGCNERAR